MGTLLRQLGTTATMSPRIKRAAHVLSDGRSAVVVPDTNRSGANGADTTGTAKIYVYLSTDTSRTSFSQAISYTPGSAPSSSTKYFVGSSAMSNNNNLYCAYQGADNSLRLITWVWNGTGWNAGTEQTVIAANAVTNRFRSVDLDVLQANSQPAVLVYEANASTGQGCWIRWYVRRTDGTTWIKAFEENIFTTQFIKAGSEDVSMAWDRGGGVSSVAKAALYYTKRHTTADNGDVIKCLSFNLASGTTNSATLLGNWYTSLNANVASSSRRGWLFSEASNQWIFAGTVGSSDAQFIAARLRGDTFTGLVMNKTEVAFTTSFPNNSRTKPFISPMLVDMYSTAACQVSAVFFAFAGTAYTSNSRVARGLVMRFDPADLTNKNAVWIDSSPRILDNAFTLEDGVIQVAAGGNSNPSIANFNYSIWYGSSGDSVSASPTTLPRKVYTAFEQTLDAPVFLSPKVNPGVNKPTVMARMQLLNLYSNALGKFQWQWATDPAFTANVKTITENDSQFQSYSSTDGQNRPIRTGSMVTPESEKFTASTTWYGRVRMLDDIGFWSGWSDTEIILLSHPPTALSATPADGTIGMWTTGDTIFSWRFSDTEPADAQTAYRVIVSRVDTGASVVDTGKVTSSVGSVSIDLASTLIGIPLQWTVQLWDMFDTAGAVSNPALFTLYEAPIPIITSPVDGDTINTGMPTITWSFNATGGRTQRAYRIRIFNVDVDPALEVADSEWILGSETSYTFPTSVLANLTTFWVTVEVQDNFGLYGGTYYNILGNPGFEQNINGWTVNGDSASVRDTAITYGGSQGSLKSTATGAVALEIFSDFVPTLPNMDYQVEVQVYAPTGLVGLDFTTGTASYNSSGSLSTSGGNLDDTIPAATWTKQDAFDTTSFDAAFVGAYFAVEAAITAGTIVYIDSVDLHQFPVWFDTDYVPPALGDISLTSDEFKVIVSWTNANLDADFVGWRVYRRYMKPADVSLDVDATATTWVLVHETTDNSASVSFYDYLAPLNKPVDYVVVQLADRFGSIVESDITSHSTITQVGDRYFFVPKIPIGSIASFEASSITGDSFTREVEQETLHVIMRGRQVQVGDDLGYIGSFTVRLRNPASARLDREFFEYMSTPDSSSIYVKSPFGDVFLIAIGSINSQRLAGVGIVDMADLTVPYSEVFDDTPVTRTDF